uniref:Uncharacterized protein n=1 Tax=Romanomermis culicivorax TaxID=13658 RepID=A0A915KVU3_ROMCU
MEMLKIRISKLKIRKAQNLKFQLSREKIIKIVKIRGKRRKFGLVKLSY